MLKFEEIIVGGIKIGTNHLDYGHCRKSIIIHPFNRIILTTAQVMFDKTGNVPVWIDAISRYFVANPDIRGEWDKLIAIHEKSKTQPGIVVQDIKAGNEFCYQDSNGNMWAYVKLISENQLAFAKGSGSCPTSFAQDVSDIWER